MAVIHIGALISGDLNVGLLDADTLLWEDGVIRQIGRRDEVNVEGADAVLDARGTTVAPGLMDSHVHVVFGDFTPRQKTVDFIESYMHGGVTSMFSASEVHVPGCPRDPVGVKALALAASRCWSAFRPAGVKVHGGSLILQPGLEEKDFAELAREGVRYAKAGFGAFRRPADAAPLVRWAQAAGMMVMCHTGGASIPGSSPVSADDLLALQPDVAGHVNGGTTALPDADAERVVRESHMALQLCQAGNLRSALGILALARDAGALGRVLIATDTPTGTGTMPLGMLKSVAELSSLGGLPAEQAWALATGNVARVYRENTGVIAVGREADLVVMDAPLGSAARDALRAIELGDLPGISAVVIDGEVKAMRSRNTPPATRAAELRPLR